MSAKWPILKGDIDILPRTLCNKKRAAVIDYLGPIGYQEKNIVFIVKPGKENSIIFLKDGG
jgi:polar amino acid transport system substrate-binding protein